MLPRSLALALAFSFSVLAVAFAAPSSAGPVTSSADLEAVDACLTAKLEAAAVACHQLLSAYEVDAQPNNQSKKKKKKKAKKGKKGKKGKQQQSSTSHASDPAAAIAAAEAAFQSAWLAAEQTRSPEDAFLCEAAGGSSSEAWSALATGAEALAAQAAACGGTAHAALACRDILLSEARHLRDEITGTPADSLAAERSAALASLGDVSNGNGKSKSKKKKKKLKKKSKKSKGQNGAQSCQGDELAAGLEAIVDGLLTQATVLPHVPVDDPSWPVIRLEAGPDLEFRAREALILAQPGTVVELPAGIFAFSDELSLNTSHVVLRGQGPEETILDFTGQQTGGQGILVTSDAFVMKDIGVLNPKGDGIRVEGSDGLVFHRVHVSWTGTPRTENGAYGLYPVGTRNILIDDCYVFGASDAGIYVGQSRNIVVRRSSAAGNVAGIEIENSINADVLLNEATDNAGGLLIFDLPGPPVYGCRADVDPALDQPDCKGTRAFANWVHTNNRGNFAPQGNIVGQVPAGTGVVILATDTVDTFGNVIADNDTVNTAVVSYVATNFPNLTPSNVAGYDDYPERINVRDNWMSGGGSNPDTSRDLGLAAAALFLVVEPIGVPLIADIVYDGILDSRKLVGDTLPEDLRLCIDGNFDPDGSSVTFGSLGAITAVDTNIEPHTCSTLHGPYAATNLPAMGPAPEGEEIFTPEEIAALCETGADPALGINWDAFAVDCPNLADYRLFQDPLETTTGPNGDGFEYYITTLLFSDYAQKDRFIFLPEGAAASYRDPEVLDFPVGTVIAKTFSFAADLRTPELDRDVIETRLLIHRPTGWVGRSWIWNEGVAELAVGGGVADVSFLDAAGQPVDTAYQIPNVNQCSACHENARFGEGSPPIGPKARLLNMDFAYPDGTLENQLARWTTEGWLSGAPAPAAAPRLPVWDDPATGSLEERARAYLESNCVHCHSDDGAARFTGLFLDHDRPLDRTAGICKPPVAAGPATEGRRWSIVPGDPDASILVFRLADVRPQIKMPELSKSLVHEEGLALVRAWIASLPPDDCL